MVKVFFGGRLCKTNFRLGFVSKKWVQEPNLRTIVSFHYFFFATQTY